MSTRALGFLNFGIFNYNQVITVEKWASSRLPTLDTTFQFVFLDAIFVMYKIRYTFQRNANVRVKLSVCIDSTFALS